MLLNIILINLLIKHTLSTNQHQQPPPKQVIDIFTNYPSTQEVIKDYNHLLHSRQLQETLLKPPDSSEFYTKTTKTNNQLQTNFNPDKDTKIFENNSNKFEENSENSKNSKISKDSKDDLKLLSIATESRTNFNLPSVLTAKASTPIEFETQKAKKNAISSNKNEKTRSNLYQDTNLERPKVRKRRPFLNEHQNIGYDEEYRYHEGYQSHTGGVQGQAQNSQWNFDDKPISQAEYPGSDVLESDFGTFEHPDELNYQSNQNNQENQEVQESQGQQIQNFHNYEYTHPNYPDLQAQASINHVNQLNHQNLLDLTNFMEVMTPRPSFLTGSSPSSSLNNFENLENLQNFQNSFLKPRRNKTITTIGLINNHSPDFIEFDLEPNKHHLEDVLESDFGEIVSTTIDRNKNRKGNVKRIPKPKPRPDFNQNHNQNQQNNPNNSKNKINKLHVGKLSADAALHGGKLKVTNLIRKYLVKMRNGTRNNNPSGSGINRRNRKQVLQNENNNNSDDDIDENQDRTFNWLGTNKKTEVQTSVNLPPGSEKYLISTGPFETIKNKTKHIASKFLSLFTVVQFANFKCQANSEVGQYEGTCYLASECAERNGIAMGMCAEGYGVCCVFRGTCGGVGSNNCTYFESPGYPNYFPLDGGVVVPGASTTTTTNPLTPDPRFPTATFLEAESRQSDNANALSCIFRVYKSDPNVKQMRIDFIDLELAGPTNGVCVNESLMITGSGLTNGVPPICGYNTGQHVLVDVSNLSGPLQLAVLANQIQRKRYKLRICQYTDGCSGLMNCLQSYTGITGTIQSFNYDQAVTFSRSMPGYFNNLNYAICIRREPGYCSVTYSTIGPNGVVYPFELRNYDDDGSLTVPAGQAGAGVINCPDDYIVVNGIRLCGDRLNDGSVTDNFAANAPVTDTSGGPIIIPVRTNGARTSRGFKLFYTQNLCGTTGGSAGTPDPRS